MEKSHFQWTNFWGAGHMILTKGDSAGTQEHTKNWNKCIKREERCILRKGKICEGVVDK